MITKNISKIYRYIYKFELMTFDFLHKWSRQIVNVINQRRFFPDVSYEKPYPIHPRMYKVRFFNTTFCVSWKGISNSLLRGDLLGHTECDISVVQAVKKAYSSLLGRRIAYGNPFTQLGTSISNAHSVNHWATEIVNNIQYNNIYRV